MTAVYESPQIVLAAALELTTFTFAPSIAKTLFSSQQTTTATATAAFERSAKAIAKDSC
ncbi:MAG: hypothetical protein AAF959_14460 [Cyanobacteria bacterium P01_D01_bin.56]